MSYSILPRGLPATKKLTFVFWFRVRKDTLDAVSNAARAWLDGGKPFERTPMFGLIPLMTLGEANYTKIFENTTRSLGSDISGQNYVWNDISETWNTDGASFNTPRNASDPVFTGTRRIIDPSYIAIDCFGDYPALSINLAMPSDNIATYRYGPHTRTDTYTSDPLGFYSGSGTSPSAPVFYLFAPGTPFQELRMEAVSGGPLPSSLNTEQISYGTNSHIYLGSTPELFRNRPVVHLDQLGSGGPDFASNGGTLEFFNEKGYKGPRVTPDRWHSVIFSIDVSRKIETKSRFVFQKFEESRVTGIAEKIQHIGDELEADAYDDSTKYITSTARAFLAYDDVNLTGMDLSVYHPHSGYKDKNALLSVNSFITGNATTLSVDTLRQAEFGRIVHSKALTKRAEYSYQPAAFLFQDRSIGFPAVAAYVEEIRNVQMGALQIYTDVVQDWGKASNKRAFVTEKGKPAHISDAEDLMGKRPEIWMPRRRNFIDAINSGTYNDDPPLPGETKGEIDPYKPDPNLYGDQGK